MPSSPVKSGTSRPINAGVEIEAEHPASRRALATTLQELQEQLERGGYIALLTTLMSSPSMLNSSGNTGR